MEPGVSNQLNDWLAIICNAIPEKYINLLETSHLFLEIDRDVAACNYYFVDHILRTVFWLHTLDIVSILSPCSLSNRHRMSLITPLLSNELKVASSPLITGKLLDSCRIVPRDRFQAFCGSSE